MVTQRIAQAQRDGKGQKPKQEALVAVAGKLTQVQVQPSHEHDVEQADGREQDDAIIALDEVEAVRADRHAGKDESDDPRHPQLAQQQGRKQDDKEDRRKNEHRVMEGPDKLL